MLAKYIQIEDYGLIGNMRTCALVATDGGLDFLCWYVNSNLKLQYKLDAQTRVWSSSTK
jgi:hypothetical protein